MKICPRCGKTYPDDEQFCETDGTALATSSAVRPPSTSQIDQPETTPIVCPECGGRAEPGETICNYCGTRLTSEPAAPASRTTYNAHRQPVTGRVTDPNDFTPGSERETGFANDPDFATQRWGESPADHPEYESGDHFDDQSERRGVMGTFGYIVAALVALAAGAGLAIYLSIRHAPPPAINAQASPSPSPGVAAIPSGPTVALARNMQIQIKSPDVAAALQRDPASARTVFENNHAALLDTYKSGLTADPALHDGMVVRLNVNPDGSVASGGVITSTATNPSLDAEVVNAMTSWKFPPVSGSPVNVDYPIIFASNPNDIGGLESDLNARLASVGPNEAPEYTSAPAPVPTPAIAALPSPSPAVLPPPAPPPSVAAKHKRQHHRAETRPPKPSLTEEVTTALHGSRRTRRVQAYAGAGGVVTLTGTVFDQKDKAFAERTVRNVPGVNTVIDNLNVQTAQWAMNQDRIQQELRSAGLTNVTVRVIGSDAYLDGTVKNNLDRQRAVTITMSAAPVHVRGNLIRVVPGNIFGF